MSDFTYEVTDSSVPLETYEWDRTWIEHTELTDAKRVFYIGDSISWGVRPEAQKKTGTEILFDAVASSKALDNPYYLPTLDLFFRQVQKPDLLIVNNGLHGWHLRDGAEYPKALETFLRELKKRVSCPVSLVLTTRVADEGRNGRVQARNAAALAVAQDLGCAVIDLYTPSLSLNHSDGVHFDHAGYQALAEALVRDIRKQL